ncbi:uncharacterized protein LOC126903003 [Daktulosphaira vitifoliae]|uniref:uncharacterized protein LOC126903003 n=1 Tax=Daktulosphaira vitifoliae TaxID=58002 RepID=UPI0021A9EC33|nr:uncharacterized protein LOC126903003 [Daktulosphaira vitifoliae]
MRNMMITQYRVSFPSLSHTVFFDSIIVYLENSQRLPIINSPLAMSPNINLVIQVFLVCFASLVTAKDGEQQVAEATALPVKKNKPELSSTPPNMLPADVSILKQINKVNDDGSYTFGYEASDGSFKVETRDVAGNVKGMFGFVDEAGQLKRVSYSANNSSGFQTAGESTPANNEPSLTTGKPSSIQTITKNNDDIKSEGVKKVLVSKRPISEEFKRRREGNGLRRHLPRNENDSPDVYGVQDRASLQSAPVSPVISALMSELNPVRIQYRPQPEVYNKAGQTAPFQRDKYQEHDRIGRLAEDNTQDDEDSEAVTAPASIQSPVSSPIRYQQISTQYQQQYQQPYPLQYQQSAYPLINPYLFNPNLLTSLRDNLMELILTFVQTRVSQFPFGNSGTFGGPYQSYPMPYQQPNYYVPNYYQGPRLESRPIIASNVQFATEQDGYHQSPRVTQTLKDGLIRMLLTTSPRYSGNPSEAEEQSTPRTAFRRTTQSTPVRNIQIISNDNSVDNRPVTTETSD